MEQVARLSLEERRQLFSETAARRAMTAAVAEKDFWVCWMLGRLFADPELSRVLLLKGGTSLSKAFHLIERFSEDIDLILDWRLLTDDDPQAERSRAQQQRLNERIEKEARSYIAGSLLEKITEIVSPFGEPFLGGDSGDDGHVINIRYPAAFSDRYLRPEIRLEIGPLAEWLPNREYEIASYAAEVFPAVFSAPRCRVFAVMAERTFWEKVTILHQEAHRPGGKPQPSRYSRHYYDLSRMCLSPVRESALRDMALLARVVAFKMRFYPRSWAHYELAVPGSLQLIPDEKTLAALKQDYSAMRAMIFGESPSFDEVMNPLRELEREVNRTH